MALDPPTMVIDGFSLLEVGMRIGKVGRQISLQGGFVAFDNKKRVCLLDAQKVPKLTVGMEGIKGTDASLDG